MERSRNVVLYSSLNRFLRMMIKYQEKPHRIRVDVSERILRKFFDHRGEISFMFDKRR